MKLFVSGATGFIGRAFCKEALRRGHEILALTRNPTPQLPPEVEIAPGSLTDTPWKQVEAFSPDTVLHLAWTAEPGIYLHSSENQIWLDQSKSWFHKLLKLGAPYIAGTGTCLEYAPSDLPSCETSSALKSAFPYSSAKIALHQWLVNHAQDTGKNVAWFRIFYPYGPGENEGRLCTSLIRQLANGTPVFLKTPQSIKDYIYIDDVASGLCSAIETRLTGAINIGTGTGISIQSIALLISNLLRLDPQLVQTSPHPISDPNPVAVANVKRLLATDWKPRISMREGLQSLLEDLNLLHA